MGVVQQITVKGFTKISTNKIYSGMHWTKRKAIKEEWLGWFAQYRNALKRPRNKVKLYFDYYWKKSPLDSSNCSYMSKMIEDCMVHYGILENDTIEFVGPVTNDSHKSDTEFCVISVEEV